MFIKFDNEFLEYSGRIDYETDKTIFVFPCSFVKMKFRGRTLKAVVDNNHGYWDNYLGLMIDGKLSKIKLSNDPGKQELNLLENAEYNIHEVMLFKRQDSCHEIGFYGFEADDDSKLQEIIKKTTGKIEVYGDSVSAGEVSEAYDFVGKPCI